MRGPRRNYRRDWPRSYKQVRNSINLRVWETRSQQIWRLRIYQLSREENSRNFPCTPNWRQPIMWSTSMMSGTRCLQSLRSLMYSGDLMRATEHLSRFLSSRWWRDLQRIQTLLTLSLSKIFRIHQIWGKSRIVWKLCRLIRCLRQRAVSPLEVATMTSMTGVMQRKALIQTFRE